MTSRFLACVTMKEGLGENHQEGPFIIFFIKSVIMLSSLLRIFFLGVQLWVIKLISYGALTCHLTCLLSFIASVEKSALCLILLKVLSLTTFKSVVFAFGFQLC